MSGLSVKVSLKQEVDAEEGLVWRAEVKDWGLKAQHEILENCLDIMQRKIVTYLQETFGTSRHISASMVTASARVEFDIVVKKDRTLKEFEGASVRPGSKDDEIIVQFAGKEPITIDQAKLDLAQKTLEMSKATGIPPEKLIEMAKKKSKEKEASK